MSDTFAGVSRVSDIIGTESRVKLCGPGRSRSRWTKTNDLRSQSPRECVVCTREPTGFEVTPIGENGYGRFDRSIFAFVSSMGLKMN